MGIEIKGTLQPGVYAKDIILALIATHGTDFGVGHVIEFYGETIRNLSMEERMTICNMSIEGGAKIGLIALMKQPCLCRGSGICTQRAR